MIDSGETLVHLNGTLRGVPVTVTSHTGQWHTQGGLPASWRATLTIETGADGAKKTETIVYTIPSIEPLTRALGAAGQ